MREDKIAQVLNDPSVRYWVKTQYRALLESDALDAMQDAELLASMLRDRWEYLVIKKSREGIQ